MLHWCKEPRFVCYLLRIGQKAFCVSYEATESLRDMEGFGEAKKNFSLMLGFLM
jgi:hypothetical protein